MKPSVWQSRPWCHPCLGPLPHHPVPYCHAEEEVMASAGMSCSGWENTTHHPCILDKPQTCHHCVTASLGHPCKGHSPDSGCRRLQYPLVYVLLHPSNFMGPHSPSATYLRSGPVQRSTWRLLVSSSPSRSPPISAIRGSLCFPWRPS